MSSTAATNGATLRLTARCLGRALRSSPLCRYPKRIACESPLISTYDAPLVGRDEDGKRTLLLSQDRASHHEQVRKCKRLGQEGKTRVETEILAVDVPGHEQHANPGPRPPKQRCQPQAVTPGHPNVRDGATGSGPRRRSCALSGPSFRRIPAAFGVLFSTPAVKLFVKSIRLAAPGVSAQPSPTAASCSRFWTRMAGRVRSYR
jgi:hypothetical protein